mgnify:FL=1
MRSRRFTELECLLIKLCYGLVQVCDRINRGMPAYQIHHSQPFPQSLHDAFQSLSLRWVQKNKKLRHPSILRMVDAARQSVEAVEPEFKALVDFADQPLIERMTYPSEECEA